MPLVVETEHMSLFDLYYDYETPAPSHPDVLGAVLAVALIVIPWLLIGWLIWLLT